MHAKVRSHVYEQINVRFVPFRRSSDSQKDISRYFDGFVSGDIAQLGKAPLAHIIRRRKERKLFFLLVLA